MKITAAVVREKSGPFILEELELDDPREDEILVRVAACGVCHTDLVCRDQYYPTPLPCVFGHEGSGIVEKVGKKVTKVKPGDSVVASYLACGHCNPCQRGLPGYCHDFWAHNFSGGRADGSHTVHKGSEVINASFFGQSTFATYALANEANTVKVPNDVPLEILGPLGCGIQTGAGGVINALRPSPGSKIAIFGAGAVGLSASMAAAASGCTTIIIVDVNPARLELAKSTFGATHTINGKEVDAVSERGKRMLMQMARPIIALMRENGWEGEWVQGLFDEPEDAFVDRYRELVSVLRGLKPDIRILEATMTMKVSGLVSIWCPQVQEYQANREFFDRRKGAGDRVWVYTCLSPGGPWLNRLLDQERLRPVYIGWALAKFDLQGYLHWGGNFHTARPFEELVRSHMEGQYLPAGDSHVLYPLPEGPLSCHRLEAHRIGFEDYELLARLRSHDAPRAEQIIARVLQGFDKYSTDVAAYRTARELLLSAVDEFPAD
jgi:Zn-dependent alcohol dehydrogenase